MRIASKRGCLVVAVVALAGLVSSAGSAVASVPPSLNGEHLYSVSQTDFGGACNPGGQTVLTITKTGAGYLLDGNYRPGSFDATINATIGPQNLPSPVNSNYTHLPVGHLLAFTETFTISSGIYTITGTKNLAATPSGLPDSFGVCVGTPGPNTFAMFANTDFTASVNDGSSTSVMTGTTYFQAIPVYNGSNQVIRTGFDEYFTSSVLQVQDVTAPTIDLTTPPDMGAYTLGQQVTADYTCADSGGSGLATCAGNVPQGQPIDTSTAGTHTFTVNATDVAGNLATVAHTYEVLAGNLPPTTVAAGGQVTTDPGQLGATIDIPVQTQIAIPATSAGGTVEVVSAGVTTPALVGYEFLGQQVHISVTATGTSSDPLVFTFTVEGALGDPAALQVTRTENGSSATLPICTGTPGTASPDPCMSTPVRVGPGATDDIQVTVYTTHASDWNFGQHRPYAFTGFFSPVNNRPTLNTAKAGSAIPVKFSLAGNQGLAIFARANPTSQKVACDSAAPLDAIEQTVTANASSLIYDQASGQYSYVWKTQSGWAGSCRQLVLVLNDGRSHTAEFQFK